MEEMELGGASFPMMMKIVIWFIIPASPRTDHNNNALTLIVLLQYIPRLYLIFPPSSEIIKATGVVTKTAWAGAAYNLLLYMLASHIILTVAEHHSAIVPWQFVAKKTGANLQFVSLTEEEAPDAGKLLELLSRKAKLVVVHHVSNVLASTLPIVDIVRSAHGVGAKVLVDACQSVPHMAVDVQSLGVDFLVASSHKALASCMAKASS